MSAKIITVFNQKGGCGKTTCSMHVAGGLALRGFRVVVLDLDPQGTAARWARKAPGDTPFPATVIAMAEGHEVGDSTSEIRIDKAIAECAERYDVILVDCRPALESRNVAASLALSDLVLVPVVPSPADLWAVEGAKALIQAERASRSPDALPVRIIPVMANMRVSLDRTVVELLAADKSMPVASSKVDAETVFSVLSNRAVFRESMAMGTTVHTRRRAQAAVEEVDALCDEIMKIIKLKPGRAKEVK